MRTNKWRHVARLIAVASMTLVCHSYSAVEEESWYKIALSLEAERVDVGYSHEVLSSVESSAGRIWEERGEVVLVVPDEHGVQSRIELTMLETSDNDGYVLSVRHDTRVNGNVESRESYRVDGTKLTYEVNGLEAGKRTGTLTMPGRPMSDRVVFPRLFKQAGKPGDTLGVVELPSADTIEKPNFAGEYRNEGVATAQVNGQSIRLRKFSYKGENPHDVYFDIDDSVQMMTVTLEGALFVLTRTTEDDAKRLWPEQKQANDAQVRVADAINLLISFYSVIETSMRFDHVDAAIVNNVRHDQFPPELEDILRRLMHLCQQGRTALESEGLVHNEHTRKVNSIAMQYGARAGTALAMEDPVSLLFAVAEGIHETQRASDDNTRKLQAVYQQFEHRMKVDKYELSVLRDKLQRQYQIPDGYLISFDVLKEMRVASLTSDPEARIRKLSLLVEKYPAYGPLNLAIATSMFYGRTQVDTQEFLTMANTAHEAHNAVLKVDPTSVNAVQLIGSFVMLNAWVESGVYPDLTVAGDALAGVAQVGLELDPTIPEFHMFQGVAAIMKTPTRVPDDTWNLLATRSADIADKYIQQQSYQWAIAYMGGRDDLRSDDEYRAAIDTLFQKGFADGAGLLRSAGLKRTPARDRILREKLTPVWNWYVTDDLLWDDVKMINESPFPLTNITLTAKLSKGGNIVTKTLTCHYLAPGQTWTWTDCVNGVDGTWDKGSTADMICDQTKWTRD